MNHLKKIPNLIFFGAPGVGKGTYGMRLSALWNIPHISMGDLVRSEVKKSSEIGKTALTYISKGQLVPDNIISSIGTTFLESLPKPGYILDGFPRTIPQAIALEKIDPKYSPTLCINFDVPRDILIKKLCAREVCTLCGKSFNKLEINQDGFHLPPLLPVHGECSRCNDNPPLEKRLDDEYSVVLDRLETYEKETKPLLKYYEDRNILTTLCLKKGVADVPLLEEHIKSLLR